MSIHINIPPRPVNVPPISAGRTAKDFLSIEESYPSVVAWARRIGERPAVQRGMQVGDEQLP